MDGGEMVGRSGVVEEAGTCWNARVTSCRDILDGALGSEGGGVSPSSDFTS